MAGWWMFFGAGQLNIKVYWDQVYKNVIAQYKKWYFWSHFLKRTTITRQVFLLKSLNSLLKLTNSQYVDQFLFIFLYLQLFYPNKSVKGMNQIKQNVLFLQFSRITKAQKGVYVCAASIRRKIWTKSRWYFPLIALNYMVRWSKVLDIKMLKD